MQNVRIIAVFFVVMSFFTRLAAVSTNDYVLSPISGEWANYQSLVLTLPKNAEAYYSFTADDPQKSGFAYDGPVLIELDGHVSINLVIQFEHNQQLTQTIEYDVKLKNDDYLSRLTDNKPFYVLDTNNRIEIPPSVEYSFADSGAFFSTQYINLNNPVLYERYLPITIKKDLVLFRYMLQIGNTDIFSNQNLNLLKAEKIPLTFSAWNTIDFLIDAPIIWQLDNNPLQETTTGRIVIDRTNDHVLKWKTKNNSAFESFFIPAQPQILGLPPHDKTNQAVYLALSDSRYQFGAKKSDDTVVFFPVYTVDTLFGDLFSFSTDIDIYYQGIKQGSFSPNITIDKIPPTQPVLTSTKPTEFSREPIELTFEAQEDLFVYMQPPELSSEGFSFQVLNAIPTPATFTEYDMIALPNNSLILEPPAGYAALFNFFIFSQDEAGNKSELVPFRLLIDPYNYYLSDDASDIISFDLPAGTKENPFQDFTQILSAIEEKNDIKVYISGTFDNIPSLNLKKNIQIVGKHNARLIFAPQSVVNVGCIDCVDSTKVAFYSLDIFKNTLDTTVNDDDLSGQTLFNIKNASFLFDDCELLLTTKTTAMACVADNASITMQNTGVSVQTGVYGAGIIARSSVLSFDSLRLVVNAETATGLSFLESSSLIRKSALYLFASLPRAIECTKSSFSLLDTLLKTDSFVDLPAVRLDDVSVPLHYKNNKVEGFTFLGLTQDGEI